MKLNGTNNEATHWQYSALAMRIPNSPITKALEMLFVKFNSN